MIRIDDIQRRYITKNDIVSKPELIQINIPLSLYANKDKLYLDEIKDQFLLKQIEDALNLIPVEFAVKKEKNKEVFYEAYMDIDNITNSIRVLSKSSHFVVDQLQNYIATRPGSIPYDPDFGCSIYTLVQTRNLPDTKELITRELKSFLSELNKKSGASFYIEDVILKEGHKKIDMTVVIRTNDMITSVSQEINL